MTQTQLVPVFNGTISNQAIQLCNARDLHSTMQVKRDFSNWIKARIAKFGFIEGEDFIRLDSPKLANHKNGGDLRSIEYHLTIDMSKELAMVENNEQGRIVRRYFIQMEREAKAQQTAQPADQNRLSDKTDRVPLKDAVNLLVAKAKNLNYSEAYTMVHQRFNIESVEELTAEQLPAVVEYVHRMIGSWEHAPVALPTPAPKIDPSQLTVHRNHVLHMYQTARQLVREIDMLGMAQDDLPKYLLA
jgi:anti-repressor protein